jgi:hypothetical protein
MKRIFRWHNLDLGLIFLILGLVTMPVQAKPLGDFLQLNPYFGAEFQYQHLKGNHIWSDFMPADIPSWAIFFGNKYHKNFGIELGFYHTLKKSESSAVLTSFDGVPASGETTVHGQIRNKGFSIDWNIYYPMDPKFNIMLILGFVTNHPTIQVITDGTTDLGIALNSVHGRNKTLFRPGVGAEYFEKNWGLRGRIFAVPTQKLTVNVDNVGQTFYTITSKAFKQSVVVACGVFYVF